MLQQADLADAEGWQSLQAAQTDVAVDKLAILMCLARVDGLIPAAPLLYNLT